MGTQSVEVGTNTMPINTRVARQALDLVLPPVLVVWVAALAWVYRTHYLVEWHHSGVNAEDPVCNSLAQWVRIANTHSQR